MILFPRKSGQHKKLDTDKDGLKHAENAVKKLAFGMPIDAGTGLKHGLSEVKKGEMPKGEEAAYRTLRDKRSEARYVGVREKRAKAKADEADSKKK